MEDKEELVKITIRIPKSQKEAIQKISAKRKIYEIDFIKQSLNLGINIQSYHDNLDFLVKTITQVLDAKLDPFLSSIKKIDLKHTRSASINTYLLGEVIEKLLPDFKKDDFVASLGSARKKANLYVNKKVDEKMDKADIMDYYRIGNLYYNE